MRTWCKVFDVNGKQILVTDEFNVDEEVYEIKFTIKAEQWLPSPPRHLSEIALRLKKATPWTADAFDGIDAAVAENMAKHMLAELPPVLRK